MSETAKESLHCKFFSTRDLSSSPRDGTSTPTVGVWSLTHWTTRVVLIQIILTGAWSPLKPFIHPSSPFCLSLGLFNISRFFFWILTNMCPLGRYPRSLPFWKDLSYCQQGEINIVTLRDDCNRLWQSYYFITKGSNRTLIPNFLINVDKNVGNKLIKTEPSYSNSTLVMPNK